MTWLHNGGIRGLYGRSMVFPLLAVLGNIIATMFFPGMGSLFMMPILASTAYVPCAPACQARPSPIERRGLSFSRWAADIEAAPFRASFRSLWLGDIIGNID